MKFASTFFDKTVLVSIDKVKEKAKVDRSVPIVIKTVLLAFLSLVLVLVDIDKDKSQFKCVFSNSDELDPATATTMDCTYNLLPLGIALFLVILAWINYSCEGMVPKFFLSFFRLCGIIWLKFLIEKYYFFVQPSINAGSFGYVILCGITMAHIWSIPKAEIRFQYAYILLMLTAAAISLVAGFTFSKFWKWQPTGLILIFMILLPAAIAILIMMKSTSEKDDRDKQMVLCFIGLCFLLMILIPSTHFDQLLPQVALVATGSLVFLIESLIHICFKLPEDEPEAENV